MLHDFQYAYRVLKKSFLATAGMIPGPSLGIGANAGSFVSISAIVLHSYPYPDIDRIMTVRPWTVNITGGDRPERVDVVPVAQDFFRVFDAKAKVGGTFADSFSEPDAARVAVAHGVRCA